jgi:hypothetical protein
MRTVLVLILAAVSCLADVATFQKPNGDTETDYQSIPTGSTLTVVTGTIHLNNLCIFVGSNAPTITVADLHGTPINLLSFAGTNGTAYFIPPGLGLRCTGGFTITASGTGAFFYASWR